MEYAAGVCSRCEKVAEPHLLNKSYGLTVVSFRIFAFGPLCRSIAGRSTPDLSSCMVQRQRMLRALAQCHSFMPPRFRSVAERFSLLFLKFPLRLPAAGRGLTG